jgi:hypothetical protein
MFISNDAILSGIIAGSVTILFLMLPFQQHIICCRT